MLWRIYKNVASYRHALLYYWCSKGHPLGPVIFSHAESTDLKDCEGSMSRNLLFNKCSVIIAIDLISQVAFLHKLCKM